jgi:DNA-binding transcriptional LysR family regulator
VRLRHIEIFHAVYVTGSVTNAANKLFVSQPSVSKVLSHAELQLGFKLFSRVKGRLQPTKEADLLFNEVDKIYRQLTNINNAADNIRKNEVGQIDIALTPALGFNVIPSALVKFRRLHPKINCGLQTLHNEQVLNHLNRHQSELAIMFAPDNLAGVNEIDFGEGNLVVVYSKKHLKSCPTNVDLEDLVDYPLIGIWESGPLANIVSQKLREKGLAFESPIRVHTYFIAVSLVKYGAGICIVDEFTARGQLSDELGIASISGDLNFPIKGLYLENKPLSQAMKKFVENLKEQFSTKT